MEKTRAYIQEKLDLAYSNKLAYTNLLNKYKQELESKSKLEYENYDDMYRTIFTIETNISLCQYEIDLYQKELDKYTEMYFEVNPIVDVFIPDIRQSSLRKKVKINNTRGGRVTRVTKKKEENEKERS